MNPYFFDSIRASKLEAIARVKGYRIFENYGKYDLNLWGIRSNCQRAGKFDDVLVIFWKDSDGHWEMKKFCVTVDPSDLYLFNPINMFGTAIIKPGQYRGVWKYGYHKNREDHPALVQQKEITVIRDFNKDDILDTKFDFDYAYYDYKKHSTGLLKQFYNDENEVVRKEDTGYFGINCHRASKYILLDMIGLYSAGCVVHQDPTKYYSEFIPVIQNQLITLGNSFTFTLITEEDLYIR